MKDRMKSVPGNACAPWPAGLVACRRAQGVSLIEVLIAVLVLSIGLLGVAALQAQALRNNQSSFQRTQAVMLSYFMLDAMRANRQAAVNGQYNLAKTCAAPSDTGNLISHDNHAWLDAVKKNLGDNSGSCGEINCTANLCTLRVYWNEGRATGGQSSQQIETIARL